MERIAEGLLWYVVFIFSTTCHEAAHALAALKLGDPTAYEGGQVTLDPLPHIRREPIGMVVMPILSFLSGGWMMGWASAPYDPLWALRYPKRSAMMALAGPLANLAIVLSSALLIRLGLFFGVFYAPDSITFSEVIASEQGVFFAVAALLSVMFSLNLLLGVFNLLPLPPLDGSGTIPFFVSEETARSYQEFLHSPGLLMVGLVIAWQVFGKIFSPIHLFALNLLYLGTGHHYGIM